MPVATLSIDLEAKLARLEQDMARANAVVERSAKRMETSFAAAGSKISGALGAISATVVVGAMAQITRSTIAGIDALNDFADATGTTVENASALEDVARRTGSSVEVVSGALIKFNTQIQEGLKPGSEAARVFELLGLNAKELAAIDPAEALVKTAQALAQFADDGNKARITYALFGKSTREVAPLLKDLADSGKLNATVTAQQAAEAEKFAKSMAQLSKNLVDVARSIANELLPGLNQLIERFIIASEKFGGLGGALRAGLGQAMRGESFDSPQKALDFYSAKLSEIDAKIKDIQANPDRGPLGELTDGNKLANLRNSREEFGKLADTYRSMVNAGSAGGGRGSSSQAPRPSVGALPAPISGAKAGKIEIPFAITDARESYKSSFLRAEKDYEETDKLLQQIQVKADEAARKLRESISEEGRRVFESTRTPAEQLAAEIEKLNKLLQAGAIDWDTYARAQLDAQERFDKATADTKSQASKTKSLGEELGLTFTSAFEDAIVGGNSLRDVLKGLEQDILRIVTRKLITEPLGNALTGMLSGGGGGGGGGGFLAGLGNWFGSLFAGGFADGGFIPPGRWGMTGERGPEPVFGGRTGVTVRPAGGMQVVQHFTVAGNADRRTQQQLAAAAARGLQMASSRGN